MLTEPTLDRLRALRLGAMADAYRTQLQDPAIGTLSFDERVGLLVDAEHLSRDNRKLGRRLKEAKLRSFVAPGQSLSLSAKLLHEGSGYAVTKADIRCDGKLTCNAEITFRLVEFPNAEFRANMEKMAAILEFPMGTLAHG